MTAHLNISVELLRELLDLPDDIVIIGAHTRDVREDGDRDLFLPITLTLEVNSAHEMERAITPKYLRDYEGDVARVRLIGVDGYRGPIDRRPSYWRQIGKTEITLLRAPNGEAK